MKIAIQHPFLSDWKWGYLRTSNENRKIIDLYKSDDSRTTISYARYLMSVHLGYYISDIYEVDHINDDKTDDRIENLQLLTKEQNRVKQEYRYVMFEQIHYGCECMNCGLHFLLTEREVKMKLAKGLNNIYCSRSCSAQYNYHVLKTLAIGK